MKPVSRLSQPLDTGRLRLRNRIVMPPMANDLAGPDGAVTERHLDHYRRRAEAGVALVIVEHSFITTAGRMTAGQLGIDNDGLIPGLKELARAITASGAASAIQLTHAGANTTAEICGCQPVGPSDVPVPPREEKPRPLSLDEISGLVELYRAAARRALLAGFDAIEIHGAHGFLLNQFASPFTNRRDDRYGGCTENRMRLSLEIIDAIGEEAGDDYPLLYRLGASDYHEGGIDIEEGKRIAVMLAAAGIDIIDVSGGLCGSRPRAFAKVPGYFVPLAEAVKSAVKVPVIAVGGITEPAFAGQIIADGRADLVAVGRAMLKNPHWAREALAQA